MELRVLNYFLTVAREESFSRAAEKLHLSQPTLSRQLKDLEEEFGKQLLIREPRRILLTDDGQLLRRRAEEILSLVEKTEGELLSSNEDISGDIRIGAGESVHFGLIMEAARQLQKQHPRIRFHIVTGDGRTTMTRLDRGLIDFAFVYGRLDPAKYQELPLPVRDQWVLFLRKDDELAKQDTIKASDLWHRPLLFSRQALSLSTHGDELLNWLQKPLEELHIAGSYTLLYNATLMVKEGMGYAISFDQLINTTGTSLCTRPLEPAIFTEPSIVWKKNQVFSKASQAFLAALQEKFNA
ncbi:MAG: LysR family transcriptional regulator [Selenomonas ruminantium]|jgi:DNA-binding transcriptional LysR family regulator|uniref:LysR family transcriptional regulator n=1 Tax=Selenomonas ruminantium TaxID=971 RepID=A0A927ZQ83_SELRU|nr:LysR family transcriptional regulator [Selenomonas ruminantium]MBE6086412.1 LysR family transcriptional regulator [Selenomonas ruminantium]